MSFLSIERISKHYDKNNHALSDFSLNISQGSVWSIVGESGSGKSTLLRIIAGLEEQDKGTVFLNGKTILNPTQKLVAGYDEIQLIHQQNDLYPHSTVEENIARPLLTYDQRYKKDRVDVILNLMGLRPHQHKLPRQLSGGQQQKVSIGRALSNEPEILLLDEPFNGLGTIHKRNLIEELKAIFEELQTTAILVTHDIDDAMTMTDQLCIIKNGRLIQKGKARQIFERPKNLYVGRLFSDLNPLPDQPNAYIRPSDLLIEEEPSLIQGEVIDSKYLVPYNRLTIILQGSGIKWKVEDRERKFGNGDQIYLGYNEEKVLQF